MHYVLITWNMFSTVMTSPVWMLIVEHAHKTDAIGQRQFFLVRITLKVCILTENLYNRKNFATIKITHMPLAYQVRGDTISNGINSISVLSLVGWMVCA